LELKQRAFCLGSAHAFALAMAPRHRDLFNLRR
jgi:hypothetical protein